MNGRALQQGKTKGSSSIVMPKTSADWDKLMRVVIATAEAAQHRSVHGLRKALVDGKSERTLRMMGIIHMGDLPRIFPPEGAKPVTTPLRRQGSSTMSKTTRTPKRNLTPPKV